MMTSATALMQRATEATSLHDFGEDTFREGLERLVESAQAEARFNAMGQQAFEQQVISLLSRRLEVEDWYRRHPEIDEQEIIQPLIGLGLPRTGSTALSCLLAEDPAIRYLRNWESMWPCPPPDAALGDDDPRIAQAEQALAQRYQLFPRMKQMVPSSATGPVECQLLMGMDFKAQLFQASAQIPGYVHWLNHEADLVPTYRYVKRVLKLLQWRTGPNRWRLKNPSHSLFIDALDTVFPDARFWMTHRDVSRVIPSVTDLYFELGNAFTDTLDTAWLGEQTTGFCELGMRRMLAFRDAGHEDRFFDVYYAQVQADPFPVLEALYEFLGEPFSDEARRRMQAWLTATPRDKHGDHRYDAADFGLDVAALQARFRFYSDRFNLPTDAT